MTHMVAHVSISSSVLVRETDGYGQEVISADRNHVRSSRGERMDRTGAWCAVYT